MTPPTVHKPGPSLARRADTVDLLHGVEVADPYRWLEDADSAETKAWVQAQQTYARAQLDALPGRDALIARLTELSYLESVSPPYQRQKRFFFSRRHKDKEKVVWYWRQGRRGEPRVLIDPNTLSDDGSVSLTGVFPSRDGRLVAYKLSENNADEATMYLMDVSTGKVSDVDTIEGAKYASASWEPGGTGFYYVRLPIDPSIAESERPGYAELYFHRIGTDFHGDQLIHEKTGDPSVFLYGDVSRDGRYLFAHKHHGWTRSDLYFEELGKDNEWRALAEGLDAKFRVYAWKDRFYIHTNHQAARWKLMVVDPHHPDLSDWKELVAEHPDAVLDDFSIIGGRLTLRYLDNASSRIEIRDLDGKHLRDIDLPGIGTVQGLVGQPDDDIAYYGFTSFNIPTTVFETSITRGGDKPYFELEVPVDPEPYLVEQVWFTSKDGTRVSMFVVRRKDMQHNGDNPVLLQGYGGFQINMVPEFVATRFAWLERGGVVAIPNLRGGSEYGEAWHRAGMRTKKQNVFDDFFAAAEYLIAERYTRPERLAIYGGSNGGLLVGAAMVQRPALFGAVVCAVPLLDMVRYHLFGSGKTWVSEYGSADDPELFKALYAYSPYHHVKPGTDYPALLMLTADSDDRVDPMHARKFVAAARYATSNERPMLLRVETNAGHGGGDMIKKNVDRNADLYAFLFQQLKMN